MPNKPLEATDENIELCLPVNAAYVSTARLTASSIANRLSFEVDEIEDIKSAVSEACTFVIKKIKFDEKSVFKLTFSMRGNSIEIALSTTVSINIGDMEEEMSLLMIRALMDSFVIENGSDGFSLIIKKTHKEMSFD